MAAGQQATPAAINQALTSYAVQLRNLCQQITNLNVFIGDLGTGGLETLTPPYNADDAASVVSYAAILNTVAAVYYGTATQATEYDFNNALAPLWAGN
jgi:phage-related protein